MPIQPILADSATLCGHGKANAPRMRAARADGTSIFSSSEAGGARCPLPGSKPTLSTSRFVLWGTRLVDWWGVDYTNKRLGEASITPEAWTMVEGRYFQTMHRDPFIGIVCGYLDQYKRPHLKILGVDLPLFEDGAVPRPVDPHGDRPGRRTAGHSGRLALEEFL